MLNHADGFYRIGQYEKAVERLQTQILVLQDECRAPERRPIDSKALAMTYGQLGTVYLALKRSDNAILSFDRQRLLGYCDCEL